MNNSINEISPTIDASVKVAGYHTGTKSYLLVVAQNLREGCGLQLD